MNRLSTERRAQIIRCLVEGNSIRSTVRITGAAKNTVVKLLNEVGAACAEYQNEVLVNLPCKHIQCDEIWSFCYAKQRNLPENLKNKFGYGDIWTWTSICADTKIVPSWLVGNRDAYTAWIFMKDLASRLACRVQVTTDGNKSYINAVENAFGIEVDFAQLIKIYGQLQDGQHRYSPPECIDTIPQQVFGNPDPKHISTSYVERQNLTMRTNMKRFTRLTNGFSRKVENLKNAVSLHFMHYNFSRIHRSLRVTPAMEAEVSDHVWSIEEIADVASACTDKIAA